jgi:hypothetical protein
LRQGWRLAIVNARRRWVDLDEALACGHRAAMGMHFGLVAVKTSVPQFRAAFSEVWPRCERFCTCGGLKNEKRHALSSAALRTAAWLWGYAAAFCCS